MYDPPVYIWAITILGVVAIPALSCVVLYLGAQRAGLARFRAALLAGVAAVVLGGWTTASAIIAGDGGYHAKLGQRPPWLPITIVAVLVALLAASRIPPVARALNAPDTAKRLILPHTPRVAGLAFLVMMGLGHLPALFALPAGLGDISVGVAAPFVARRLAQGTGRRGALWFNRLGILDLLVALALGALTGYQLLSAPPNDSIGELPLALIPTAAVPLLIALHVLSLRRLAATPQEHPKTITLVGRAAA
jgi:hypothetical protein